MASKVPTRVTILDSTRILVEIGKEEDRNLLTRLGFEKSKNHDDVYGYRSDDSSNIFQMAENLRDMGIPFTTDRIGGADYAVETFRARGQLTGRFKRINFFGRDYATDAKYSIEDF